MSCPDCFRGADHSHLGTQPQGHFETLHGVRTYIAGNESRSHRSSESQKKATIIYFPDFFSFNLVNNQLLADRYANETNFRVLFPDIIPNGGGPVSAMYMTDIVMRPAGFNPFAWLRRILNVFRLLLTILVPIIKHAPEKLYPDCLRYTRAVRASLAPGAKLGVAGFCWGGYQSTNLCTEAAVEGGSDRLVDAQFCAHPSKLKTPAMIVDAITKFKVPYSVAVAELDLLFNKEKAEETEAAVRKREQDTVKLDYEFVVHKGCRHSFAVRASPDHKVEIAGLDAACKQAVSWYKKYLS